VVADFDGGHVSSDGGLLLLRELDQRRKILKRFAACFRDGRAPDRVEHSVEELLRQRVFAIAQGYEDVNDHDTLRTDPLLALAVGKLEPEGKTRKRARDMGKALAGKSTLNRLEQPTREGSRYCKISHGDEAIESLFVSLFLESFSSPPDEIILDFDATDDPLHGHQEGRFFHGYYDNYCYLPLYVFCGDHLLLARLRTSDRDGADGADKALLFLIERIRARWPRTRIIVRGDSGFAREYLMNLCEEQQVHYLFGLARNKRLQARIGEELGEAHEEHKLTGLPARRFTHFHYQTRKSWSRARHVIAKAEHLAKGSNPRFIVTNLPEEYAAPKDLYERVYCARGDMENRIKEQQMDLFAGRTSASLFAANQLRLWLSSLAYTLLATLRRIALYATECARATCGTLRLRLLKIGALLNISVRRIRIRFASAAPWRDQFRIALGRLRALPELA
jgi:hypothetical protein